MAATETIQFQVTPELRRQLENEAAALHLSLSAYVAYLHARRMSEDPRFDRHVHEVFGKRGELMRRLAK